jgi:hypothetical protein
MTDQVPLERGTVTTHSLLDHDLFMVMHEGIEGSDATTVFGATQAEASGLCPDRTRYMDPEMLIAAPAALTGRTRTVCATGGA